MHPLLPAFSLPCACACARLLLHRVPPPVLESIKHATSQLTGFVSIWHAANCIKSAGLATTLDVQGIIDKYTGRDNKFHWVKFVEKIEKSSKKYANVAVSASTLSRSPSNALLLKETHAKMMTGQAANLPALLRVGSQKRLPQPLQ